MKLKNSKILRWQNALMLLFAMLIISACSLLEVPENIEPVYEGAPVVRIAAPQPNDTYYEGVGVNVVVRVENAGPDIARVVITLDGQIIGEQALPNSSGAPSFVVATGWTAESIGTHTIGVTASRNDGTSNIPAEVSINVVQSLTSSGDSQTVDAQTAEDPTSVPPEDTTQGETTPAPTNPPLPTPVPVEASDTPEPEPTEVPATNTPSKPQVRVVTGANIRFGPNTVFNPPIGSLAAGAVEDILAISTDGQWYKITYYNGDGWIFGNTVEVVGDTSNIPREAGPATPVPATNTPVATATPVAVADLSIVDSSTNPEFECGNSSEITITVANTGTGTSGDTRIVVEDLFNGQVGGNTEAPIRSLAPNETTTVTVYLTISTNVLEGHTSRFRVDPDNRVPETNENNNTVQRDYVLAQGSC